MKGFRDIHAHFVYGVDDGAQTYEDMTAMLDAAHQDGITALFSTPHITPGIKPFPQERFERHFRKAQNYCAEKGYDIRLDIGAELLYTPAIARYAQENELRTMGDSDMILLEFVPKTPFKEIRGAVRLMEQSGYLPILAHIERYEEMYHGNAFRLMEEADVRYQVNCQTVLKRQGFFREREIRRWFREGIIDFVASDAHNCTFRATRMREAYEALKQEYGEEYAGKLTGLNRKRGQ